MITATRILVTMSTREMRAEQLKIARSKTGLTQEAFAVRLGLPLSTYRRYEQGVTDVPIEVYAALADHWQVDLNEIILGKSKVPFGETTEEIELEQIANKRLVTAMGSGLRVEHEQIGPFLEVIIAAMRKLLERDRRRLSK